MALFVRIFTNTAPREEIDRHLPAHLAYLRDLVREGKLRCAGPFGDGSGGMEILDVKDRLEAKAVVARDPFVTNRLGGVELREFRDILPGLAGPGAA